MPISGLVLILNPSCPIEPLLDSLDQHPDLMYAPPMERRVPVVSDTRDAEHDKVVWSWLRAREEVLDVAVAMIHDDSRST